MATVLHTKRVHGNWNPKSGMHIFPQIRPRQLYNNVHEAYKLKVYITYTV